MSDGQDPRAKVLAVLEPSVRAERAQEGLLERIVGAVDVEAPPEKAEHLASMLLVEQLERRDRHCFHHPRQTPRAVDL